MQEVTASGTRPLVRGGRIRAHGPRGWLACMEGHGRPLVGGAA